MRVPARVALGLVAVAAAASCSRDHSRPATDQSVPFGLVNVGWLLTSTQREGQSAEYAPSNVLIMRVNGAATFDVSRCDQWVGVMRFDGEKVEVRGRISPHSCPPGSTVEDPGLEPFEAKVLQGSLRWSLDAGRLVLTKGGVGLLTFARGPQDPPSPTP